MEDQKIMKSLETKILQMNSQIESQKLQNELLLSQGERIKKLLADNNKELQLKSIQLQKLMETNCKLKAQNQVLQKSLISSQHHRKSLYDHLFTNNKEPGSGLHNEIHNSLSTKLRQLNDQFVQCNYQQFKNIINQRNNEVKKVSKQYSQLMKQFIKSSNQYQQKILSLKQQNSILHKKQILQNQIQSQIKKSCAYNENPIYNKSLEQRIQLLFQKLRVSYSVIDQLKKQLKSSQKLRQHPQIKVSKQSDIPQEVQKVLQILNENRRLKNQIQQASMKYEKLIIEFPNIVKNQEQIQNFVQKCKQVTQLLIKNEQKQIKIKQLTITNNKLEEDITKYQTQFNEKIIEYQGKNKFYQMMIEKLKNFFKMANPYFETYEYNQLDFTQKQLSYLKNDKQLSQQTRLKIDIAKLQEKCSKAKTQVQLKNGQIAKLHQIIESQIKKIGQIQTINSKLVQTIQSSQFPQIKQIEEKEGGLQSFIKIQDQRNNLKKQIRERDVKIIQLMVELDYLKQKQLSHVQDNKVLFATEQEINFSRPSILWINFNKDIGTFVKKIAQLENQIEESLRNYQSNIKTIRSEYQTKIIKLQQKISKIQIQTNLKAKDVAEIAEVPNQSQNQMQEERNQQQITLYEANSIFDMEEPMIGQQNTQQPAKTLSSQSIQEMSRVFSSHQINLKNILQAYNSLRLKFEKLEKQTKQSIPNENYNRLQKNLQNSIIQIKAVKGRLEQADKNLLTLQTQLALKSSQLVQYKQAKQLEIRNLKLAQYQLSNQIKMRKQENSLEKAQYMTKIKSKHYFPQQIQYLVELVFQKHEQLLSLRKSEKQVVLHPKQGNIKIIQSRQSSDYKLKEINGVQELIVNGELLDCLKQAIVCLNDQE